MSFGKIASTAMYTGILCVSLTRAARNLVERHLLMRRTAGRHSLGIWKGNLKVRAHLIILIARFDNHLGYYRTVGFYRTDTTYSGTCKHSNYGYGLTWVLQNTTVDKASRAGIATEHGGWRIYPEWRVESDTGDWTFPPLLPLDSLPTPVLDNSVKAIERLVKTFPKVLKP